jgi:hypothetical protein
VKGVVTARVNVSQQVLIDVLWDVCKGTKRSTVKVINIRTGDVSVRTSSLFNRMESHKR